MRFFFAKPIGSDDLVDVLRQQAVLPFALFEVLAGIDELELELSPLNGHIKFCLKEK